MDTRRMVGTPQDDREGEYGTPPWRDEGNPMNEAPPTVRNKLIVSERRRGGPDSLKASKDCAQADFLVAALAETRPDELRLAYNEGMDRGGVWRKRIAASLKRLPAASEHLLEMVDGEAPDRL